MKIHKLKLDSRWIEPLKKGEKKAEIRYNDRDYKAGDVIEFVGIEDIRFEITHITEFPE